MCVCVCVCVCVQYVCSAYVHVCYLCVRFPPVSKCEPNTSTLWASTLCYSYTCTVCDGVYASTCACVEVFLCTRCTDEGRPARTS